MAIRIFQNGNESHSAKSTNILGAVEVVSIYDSNSETCITHLVIIGSSKWEAGRNVTRKASIQNI